MRAALGPAERAAVDAAIRPLVGSHGGLVFGWWLVAAGLAAWAGHRLHRTHVVAPARLANSARVLAEDAGAPELPVQGGSSLRGLAAAINSLAAERRGLKAEMARLVEEASCSVAEQRDQLAALMSELDHAVVVCALDGRILLYNGRMLDLSRQLSRHAAGGAEVIGLGRSIHALIDRGPVHHALETVERRIARGSDRAGHAAKFVTTTAAGHLLQVSLAPVRPPAVTAGDHPGLTGFVLLVDDITANIEARSRRDSELLRLTESTRASAASMQAALEMLELPDLAPEERERFLRVIRDEVTTMGSRLDDLAASSLLEVMTRWPLQEMLGSDLVAAAQRRIVAATGEPVIAGETRDDLWLNVDSFSLIEAIAFVAGRVAKVHRDPRMWLRLVPAGGTRAHLDLGWHVAEGAAARLPATLARVQSEPIDLAGTASPVSVRDVVERHGGEVWLGRDRSDGQPFFRFLLPLAPADAASAATNWPSRPEFYDFDLFAAGRGDGELDDQPLSKLSFTVFDTETTGLDPAGGDEIIQIGAVRIVNGRILRGECIDQLVDPQRSIPEAGIPIHGIHPAMVRGQPTIVEALPTFHAFAGDSVLVGHNIAFDMRFLKLKEARTGLRFDQPLLDTLLLSSIVHPDEPSHSLEAIAGRLGTDLVGRHTALGDALATAEVFVRLIPLLAQQGIVTLGEARVASGSSQFARLEY
nr:exonuclease domain-containing protein [Paracoccus sp. S-4012]